MGTVIRAELSQKNKYWIDRHRYYELKHFCLQYPYWNSCYGELSFSISSPSIDATGKSCDVCDPVARYVEKRMFYRNRMDLIERLSKETDPTLWCYIFKGVTEGLSYEVLRVRMDIPCCKDVYYEAYRRFFWLLSEARQ